MPTPQDPKDLNSLPAQALTPPTAPGLPETAQLQQPGQPSAQANSALADWMMRPQRQAAAQVLASTQGANPDREAKALELSRQLGIPQPAVEADLEQAQQSALMQQNKEVLDQSPNLSAFVASNPLAARMAVDDFNKLGTLEQLWTALKTGASSALQTNELGRAGNVKQLAALTGTQTPQTDAEIQQLQMKLAATPQLAGGLGVAQRFTGFLTGLVDNAISALPETAAGGLIGAAGAGIGAAPGAVTGFTVGFNADMARVAAGNTYLKLSQMRSAEGLPISEAGKQFGAIFTGVATYALGRYASKLEGALGNQTAEALAQQAVEKAVTAPTFTAAMERVGSEAIKGAGQGAAIMTAMEASAIIGEQIGKTLSSGTFKTDTGEIVDRLSDAAINGAVLLGALHGSMHGLGLYGDLQAARRAQAQTGMLQNILAGSAESKLRDRDLQSFQDFSQHQVDGSPVENFYVPADLVRELYQSAKLDGEGLSDRTQDPLFGFVKDMPQQLAEARDTGGDVVIPAADFVSHLAGTPLADQLLPDVRVSPDAMSLYEAKTYFDEYRRRAQEATLQATDGELLDPQQRIAEAVRQQAAAAGYSDLQANQYAQIYAARYSTRAERLGIDPWEAFKQSGVSIRKGAEGEPVEVQGSQLGPSWTKDIETQANVGRRKRLSVLKSIMECLEGASGAP